MDSDLLAEMLHVIDGLDHNVHEIFIARHGVQVLSAVKHPYSLVPDARFELFSITKSVVSILIGIAIDQGYIEDIDQPVLDFFPDISVDNIDAHKRSVTLEHLLTMTTGLNCRDSYLYRWDGLMLMRASEDWVQFMLDLPMIEDPGSRFEYCNGASFLLSAILLETTGMNALEFGLKNLFGPLGIRSVRWPTNHQGISIGYSELEMHPEDLAKIGYLYLNQGEWDGQQIVSSDWVHVSTQKHVSATLQEGYGYHWWVDESGIIMALGYGGQYLIIAPEEELVVVFISDLPEEEFFLPERLLNTYILGSIQSDQPLPDDPQALEVLEQRIQELTEP